MSGGNVIPIGPGIHFCEECDGIARGCINGAWLCTACAEQLAAVPAPASVPAPARDDERFGAPLEEIVDRLLSGS